ncbi:hypothetical protein BURKHO8Y_140552 [Burkholderia sp. 8Y]|nr:hypothetical protein BURKHO8Y_140552 [Burkholderia sp. 8Y]
MQRNSADSARFAALRGVRVRGLLDLSGPRAPRRRHHLQRAALDGFHPHRAARHVQTGHSPAALERGENASVCYNREVNPPCPAARAGASGHRFPVVNTHTEHEHRASAF